MDRGDKDPGPDEQDKTLMRLVARQPLHNNGNHPHAKNTQATTPPRVPFAHLLVCSMCTEPTMILVAVCCISGPLPRPFATVSTYVVMSVWYTKQKCDMKIPHERNTTDCNSGGG